MAWNNLATRTTADANASADINTLMENIRILGGNGTTAPSSDIETLKTAVDAISAPTSQAGAPSSTPGSLGLINIDTTANRMYISTGTSSSADWDRVGVSDYGTETITAAGGDITVNLDWDWSGGMLYIFVSDDSTKFYDSAGIVMFITSYDALTNAGYSGGEQSMRLDTNPGILPKSLSGTDSGTPNAATSTSFTLNENGTVYIKWMVMA